jgi:phosphatidylethanolamine-binding protein (PEBP) family uncharacterized protein
VVQHLFSKPIQSPIPPPKKKIRYEFFMGNLDNEHNENDSTLNVAKMKRNKNL